MRNENKVWIIDLGETIDPKQIRNKATVTTKPNPSAPAKRTAAAPEPPRQAQRPATQAATGDVARSAPKPAPQPAPRPVPRGVTPPPQRTVRRTAKAAIVNMSPPVSRPQPVRETARSVTASCQPAKLLLLTYVLGPLALLAIPQGRSDRKWSVSALVAGAAGLLLLIRWGAVQMRMATGQSSLAWFVAAGLVIALSLVTWGRAIVLTGRMLKAPQTSRLPYWLRLPWSTGLAGLVVPGLGHLIAGRARRAAVALSLLGPTAMAALVLTHADRLWLGHQAVGLNAAAGLALERTFLFAAAALVIGAMVWIASALDAARLQGGAPALRRRQRGDWFAAALVLTLVVSAAAFRPAGLAQRLDHYAVALQDEGLQLVPLWFERSAAALDPAQPVYTLRCADLYAGLGENDRAVKLRESLDDRWVTYATMLRAGSWDEAAERADNTARRPEAKPGRVSPPSSPAAERPAPKASVVHRPAAAAVADDRATGVSAVTEPSTTIDQLPAVVHAKLSTAVID